MVIILWGLVFSKCLALEYLIQVYSVPINSFFYIWLLTLTMASFATVSFLRAPKTESFHLEKISVVNLVWSGCGITGLLSICVFYLANEPKTFVLATVIAVILGIGHLVHGIIIRKNMYIFSGIGWWVGAAVLATQSNLESLAIFAFLIILLAILPRMIEMRQQKTGFF